MFVKTRLYDLFIKICAELCGTDLMASSAEKFFMTPQFPSNYPPNLECKWTISAPWWSIDCPSV